MAGRPLGIWHELQDFPLSDKQTVRLPVTLPPELFSEQSVWRYSRRCQYQQSKLQVAETQLTNMKAGPTLNANFSRASEKPGNGWYLVPAFATIARCVVGPGKSRLANFTPEDSPVS